MKSFRKSAGSLILAVLVSFIVAHAPWRLLALFAETFVVHPGLTRTVQTNDRYWDVLGLQDRIEGLGYRVSFDQDLRTENPFFSTPVFGLTIPQRHTVQVEAALSWDARYAILAHEGGHIFDSPYFSREESEAFAEAVAMLIAHDGIREHARYLSSKKFALFTVVMLDSARVYRAAAVLQE